MHPRTTSTSRLRVAWLAALVVLQACGGGGEGSSTTTSGGSAAPGPAPATGPAPAPAPGTAPGTAPAGADITCGLANFAADALRLINERRAVGASCGAQGNFAPAPAVAWQTQLTTAAYGHSRDMADNDYFSHTGLNGSTLGTRVTATGYGWSALGENIAAGQPDVVAVIAAWMGSDGHCANMMNPRFTEFGLACARSDTSRYRIYWTLDLGRP